MFDRIKSVLGLNKRDYSGYLQPVNFEDELTQSELSPEQIDFIYKASAGVFSIYDYIDYRREEIKRSPKDENVYAFSLTRYNDIPLNVSVSKALKLMSWSDAFDRLGIWDAVNSYLQNPENNPDLLYQEQARIFIRTLNLLEYSRVFFIPRSLYSYPGGEFLKSEVEYTLNDPQKSLPLSYFVFGLEQCIPEDVQAKLPKVERKSYVTGMVELLVDSTVVAAIINGYKPGIFG